MTGNILILLFAALSVIYVGLCAYAYVASDSLIFPSPEASYTDNSEIIKLSTSRGDMISALFFKAINSKHVLLYSHGNGEDLGMIRPTLEAYQNRGISVFAYDYPGYGTSTGQASEESVYAAIETAYLYLINELGYTPEVITLYGRSLGSGPSAWLAEHYPVSGLIIEGGFTSTFRVLTGVKLLPFDKFDNLARLPKLDCPILLIHGEQDAVVTFEHGLKNHKALNGANEVLWVAAAGHNDVIEQAGDGYWGVVRSFITGKP